TPKIISPPPPEPARMLPTNPVEQTAAPLQKISEQPPIVPTNQSSPIVASVTPAIPPAVETPKAEPIPPPPATPTFPLHAIYYRMKGPTVVINGKTLRVGDEVNGARLISIERTSAEIEFQGAKQKLAMH